MSVKISEDDDSSFNFKLKTEHGSFTEWWPGEEASDYLAEFIGHCREKKSSDYVFNATNGWSKIEYDSKSDTLEFIEEYHGAEACLKMPATEGIPLLTQILDHVNSKPRKYMPGCREPSSPSNDVLS